jgi:hypothetical protein
MEILMNDLNFNAIDEDDLLLADPADCSYGYEDGMVQKWNDDGYFLEISLDEAEMTAPWLLLEALMWATRNNFEMPSNSSLRECFLAEFDSE